MNIDIRLAICNDRTQKKNGNLKIALRLHVSNDCFTDKMEVRLLDFVCAMTRFFYGDQIYSC